jgi:hypothetical protein
MAVNKITNDRFTSLLAANIITSHAGKIMHRVNGHPLTPEQENDNLTAELLSDFANEMREKHGATARQPQPTRENVTADD